MSLSSRSFRRSFICLLCMLSGFCAAQPGRPQFTLPQVWLTAGQVTSFLTGNLQEPLTQSTDFLYLNAINGANSSILAGELLDNLSGAYYNLGQDQITFTNVSNVAAALADINHDGIVDYVFALTPTVAGANNLCIYFGSGLGATGTAYDGAGNPPTRYPPTGGGKSGCIVFPVQGTLPPNFAYVATPTFKKGLLPNVLIEDSANNLLYIFSNSGAPGFGGSLPGISLNATLSIPAADGTGPIYVGDFNSDGNTDFIINGQNGHSASVYLGNGDGTFQLPARVYRFDHGVHSMLLQDMDGDGILDMVVEGDKGVIEIFKGHADGSFGPNSIGGTAPGLDAFSGNGGHLAAIGPLGNDTTPHIFTTTPIGLSVLQAPVGSLAYSLSGIYNIGPGRNSFALFDSNGDGYVDLSVDSAEGVAIVLGDKNGLPTFQTSHAYSSLAPALSSTVGKFRTSANPKGNLDVVVSTGAAQAQLLTGNGDGSFNTFAGVANTSGGTSGVLPNLWSNVVSGDFNGDGIPDIAYSLTGLPLPAPNTGVGLYVQYGKGDGTFAAPVAVTTSSANVPSNNTFFGTSAVGDFNGDNIADLANIDAAYDDTLLGQNSSVPFSVGLLQPASNNANFNQVAAGFFKANRLAKQDLIFQQGGNLVPYVNSGDGKHFNPQTPLAGTPSPSLQVTSTVLIADLDRDGNGDVIAVYYNPAINPLSARPVAPNQLYIWYGNGDGTFSPQPQIINLLRNDYLGAVGDLNNDGLPDIVLSDGSIVTVLYNQGARTFRSDFGTACNPCAEQHFLAGQGINSLSLVDINKDGTADLIVANGGATISNPLALGGATQTSLSLTPNADVNTGGITVLVNNVVTQPVTGTLTAMPEPSGFQGAFTITATLTPSTGIPVPTGTVTFFFDGNAVCSYVNVTTGATTSTASCAIPANNGYTAGTHTLVATYGGDQFNSTITLNAIHKIVNSTTTTVLALCIGPTAACPATGLVFPPIVANLSMTYGQIYNGTAQVTPADGGPIPGNLTFYDLYGGVSMPLCSLVAQTGGSCPPSVGTGAQVGTHVLTATYAGDTTHSASTSNAVTITVSQDTTTATVSSSLNPAPFGQAVTFTATLAGAHAPPTGANAGPVGLYLPPAGSVVFMDGATVLGTGVLTPSASGVASTATLTTSTLSVGTHPITVTYAASVDFAAIVSPVLNQVITQPPPGSFTLSVTPNPVSVGVGFVTALTVKVTPVNGFSQTVNLACGTLPNEMTCTFLNAAIAAGGGTTTLFVSTTAPHSCGTNQPYFLGSNGGGPGLAPFTLPALAGLLVTFLPGKRRWLRALVAILVVAAVSQMTGCGNCTDLGNRPGTYTFQVSGSSTGSSSEVESQTVTLNVTI
jgi:Bacterial Ig-like domain (group 3)/FG-GAP-like repeat